MGGASPVAGWVTFACVMWLMLVPGTIYAFGEWSALLKEDGFSYVQTEVQFLALMANLGNYVTIDAGLLASRVSITATLCYGSVMACAGYVSLWFGIVHGAGEIRIGVMAFFCALYGHGCGCIDVAAVTELLHTFPDHKGNAVGCVKAFYGLAAATVAIIYDAVFAPTRTDFLLFLGCFSGVIGVLLVPVIHWNRGTLQEDASVTRRKFKVLLVVLVLAAVLFCVVALNSQHLDAMPNEGRAVWRSILGTVIVGVGCVFLLAVPPIGSTHEHISKSAPAYEEPTPLVTEVSESVSGFGMLTKPDFYVLLAVLIVCQGSGLMLLNNAAQLLPAYVGHTDDAGVTSFVAVISCFNSLGRLVWGNLSEALKGRVHRPLMLVVSCVLLSMGYAVLHIVGLPSVWVVGSLIGFAYGGLWGVQPVIVAEMFGSRDLGFKYSCSTVAALLGSLCFSTLLAGTLADREAEKLGTTPECFSPSCYDSAALVTALCGIPSTLLATWLWYRTRHIYDALNLNPTAVSEKSGSETETDT